MRCGGQEAERHLIAVIPQVKREVLGSIRLSERFRLEPAANLTQNMHDMLAGPPRVFVESRGRSKANRPAPSLAAPR